MNAFFGRGRQKYYPGTTGGGRRKLLITPIILALLFLAVQYFSAETYVNPETGKSAKVALSAEQEARLGLQSFEQVLAQSDVIGSGPEHQTVIKVANKLIAVLDEESRQLDWDARLIRSEQVNAFCLPGGKIAIFSGILPVAENEDGLAAVMGHEIAHATARHGAQRIFQQNLIQTGLMGLQGAVSEMDHEKRRILLGALGAGVQFGLILPYSREHEYEADEIGLHYMTRAGYDPNEAIRFWQRMAKVTERQPVEWASTHPAHESRIERLRALIPRLKHPTP